MKSKSLAATAALRATVGLNIRCLRSYRGWSQTQLAAEAGLSTAMIGKLENGCGNPRVTTLAAVAKALGVAPHALFVDVRSDTTTPRAVSIRRSRRSLAQ